MILTATHHAAPLRVWSFLWRWTVTLVLASSAAGCASLPANEGQTASRALQAPEQTTLGRMVQERRTQAKARGDSGFWLLDSVESAFTSRLALISSAERTLDLQYYAIHADNSTELLLQRLRDAARRGVRVRILLDDFNIVGKDAQVLRLAFEPHVEIRLFNPLAGSRSSLVGRLIASVTDIPRIQKRMHNKLFIADNAIGITGGRNLGDAYFGTADKANFVDLDVLAAGRIVRDMSLSFDRYWNDELAYPVQTLISQQELEALRKPPEQPTMEARATEAVPASSPSGTVRASVPAGAVLPDLKPAAGTSANPIPLDLSKVPLTWAPSLLLVDKPEKIGPGDDEVDAGDTLVDGLLHLMEQARQDVLIISPYFVPGSQMMAMFERLRDRKVRVRVLTNSLASTDAPAAHAGYARYRKRLLSIGVELHEMRAQQEAGSKAAGSTGALGSAGGGGGSKSGVSHASLHSKAVIIDGRLAVIGSMNLDLRSQRQNSEVALLLRSTALAQEAARQVEITLANNAYRLLFDRGQLVWRAPAGAQFEDARVEPGASARLKLMVRLIAPFAPDVML